MEIVRGEKALWPGVSGGVQNGVSREVREPGSRGECHHWVCSLSKDDKMSGDQAAKGDE